MKPKRPPLKTLPPRLATLPPRVAPLGGSGAFSRTSRHARGYGSAWVRLREQVLQRDCGLCCTCKRAGITRIASQVDHVTPKSRGGTDDLGNLEAICAECHQVKTQRESRGE